MLKLSRSSLVALTIFLNLQSPNVAFSQETVAIGDIESDATYRIDNAAMVSALTMRAAGLSCAIVSGVETDRYTSSLVQVKNDLIQILNGLRDGDEALHLVGEENAKSILSLLGFIEDNLPVLERAVETASDTSVERVHFMDHALEAFTNRIFLYSEVLSATVAGKYSDPFVMTQADTLMISLAARQRMLSQRLLYSACYAGSDFHPENAQEQLSEDIVIFERTLDAMRNGLPDLGIQSAPTPEIEASVEEVAIAWDAMKESLNVLSEGGELPEPSMETLLSNLDTSLETISELTDNYSAYATRHHSQ